MDTSHDVVERIVAENIDVVFIALHGRWGEDGTVQGLLELLRIPYTGSGVLASALAMHKIKSKELFTYYGIPTPEFVVPSAENIPKPPFPAPWVVKPASEGSTIGIHIIDDVSALNEAVDHARHYDDEVLVERYIKGRELTVGILNGEPLPIVEIVPKSGFYDYTAKYTVGMTEYVAPAVVETELTHEAQRIALQAYRSLRCSGCARVDLRLGDDRSLFVIEVNTLPGMTETSLVPKAAAVIGLTFSQLVCRILEAASLKINGGKG
jgi:D-alanine-D-alanine ligase